MKRIALSLMVIFLFGGTCFAATDITAASDPWPPFTNPDTPEQGLSLEIARAALGTQGYTITMNFVPWARAEEGVRQGNYDILTNMWMTESRKKDFLFSEPYAENQIKFIKRKGDPFEYENLESLKGLSVGVIRGYGYGDDFWSAPDFRREETGDLVTNVKKLVAGRIDLTLEDEIVARYILSQKAPELLEQIEFTEGSLSSNKLYVASGFKNASHKELIEAFNKGLAEIKADGTYDAIFAKYGISK